MSSGASAGGAGGAGGTRAPGSTAVPLGALLAGAVYLVVLLGIQTVGAGILGATGLGVGAAAAILVLLGVVAAMAGGAVGAVWVGRRGGDAASARAAGVLGPAVFALLGILLVVLTGVGLSLVREVVTLVAAAGGGWLGAGLAHRG